MGTTWAAMHLPDHLMFNACIGSLEQVLAMKEVSNQIFQQTQFPGDQT